MCTSMRSSIAICLKQHSSTPRPEAYSDADIPQALCDRCSLPAVRLSAPVCRSFDPARVCRVLFRYNFINFRILQLLRLPCLLPRRT